MEQFNRSLTKNLLFLSTFATSLRCYAKGDLKSRVRAWCKLWIYWFVKKQRYEVLVNFWRLLWGDLQFKGFCWHCPAGRHRGLSTVYIKHNLFHHSKLGRDVELQNTQVDLFKSPRDVMQVTTLSTQLGVGSELVDWYRDATSVPFGHLLIDLSPRTDDRLRYCTNTGSIPSKLYIPDRLKQSKVLNDEHTKSLYSPKVPIIFPQMQKSFPSVLPKRVYPVSLRMHNKPAQRKLQSIKRHHATKFQSHVRLLSLKRTTWKQRRHLLASGSGLQLIKVFTLHVINQLSWYGPVCLRSLFSVQQKFDYPVSYKAGTSKVSTFTKSHVPNWFT